MEWSIYGTRFTWDMGSALVVGKKLKERREAKGWSRSQLALRAGLGRHSIRRIEEDLQSPTIGTLARIAGALEVHVTDLIEEKRTDG